MVTMLPNLIAFSLIFQGTSQEPQEKPRPIYSDIISRTTGQNGYEEYVRAADLLRLGPAQAPYAITFGYYEPNRPQPPFLQSRRELMVHGQKVLDLIRAGNKKPVFEPREKLGVWTLFPEFAYFK